MAKDGGQYSKILEEVLDLYDGDFKVLKDPSTMGSVFKDLKKKYPAVIDDEFITSYENTIYKSSAENVNEIIDILCGMEKPTDIESLVKYLDTVDPEWIKRPKTMMAYFKDNKKMLEEAHGVEFVSKIERIIEEQQFNNSEEFLGCIFEENDDVEEINETVTPEVPETPEIKEEVVEAAPEVKEEKPKAKEKTGTKKSATIEKKEEVVAEKPVDKKPVKTIEVIKAPKEEKKVSIDKPDVKTKNFTRFEKARIVGARALQISYGAPVLVDYPEDMLDPIDIALLEFDQGVIPISVVKN